MGEMEKQLAEAALKLPARERARIAEQLLQSLDQPDLSIQALWAEEAEARLTAYEQGKVKATSVQEVLARYRKT